MYNDLQLLIQIASSDDVTWESALLRVFDDPGIFGILTSVLRRKPAFLPPATNCDFFRTNKLV